MIKAAEFVAQLESSGVRFFAGVPDSLLKSFCAHIQSHLPPERHVITANEGNAIALCIGHYLGTGSPGLVYLQNSGLGNVINPLTSLADPEVCGIPMCLLIGWRGEPGVKDEPQHIKQGRISEQQLATLEIPYWLLEPDCDWQRRLNEACCIMRGQSRPVALLVRSGAFENTKAEFPDGLNYPLSREDAIKQVLAKLETDDLVVASTGHISREVHACRLAAGAQGERDFLSVGGMGHTASIALGLALAQKERRVVCLDGDGSVLMHMGMMPVIGSLTPSNLIHVVLNNGAHGSVGGQPTAAFSCDLPAIARASGYRQARMVSDLGGVDAAIAECKAQQGPVFIEIRVRKAARADLERPKSTPLENRDRFMASLGVTGR